MSYENIRLNLNGNLYPISQQNEVKDVEEFENVFFSEDGEYDESWATFSDKQSNGNVFSSVNYIKEELTEEEILIQQLEAEIAQLESEYAANQEGKGIAGTVGGFFSSCWNGITGKGFKNNDRAELDAKIAMLKAVKSDPAKLNEAYKTIMGTELTEEAKQSAVEAQKLADSMSEEEKQQVVEMLQQQAASLSTLMEQTQDDQGWFSKAMGGLNNVLGFGTNSNKANAKVEEYIKQVNSLDPNDPDFAAKYQALTGEALSVDGLDELSQGVSKVGNSPAAEAIMDYEETQAAAKEIGSGIVTGVVVAACVIAAPFTGGASIALGAAVGGATTVLINGTDTIGTSKKYSLEQGILDFGGGAINGAITAMTLGGAGIAGKGFSALKGAGSAAAKQGAKQMVSGGFKNTVKTAFNGFGKSALNGAKIAAFAASSNYLLDTVGTNALYDITGNLAKSETPANIVQNEDGTYSVYYELKDANTGEVISYEIETVETLSQDEDGGLIKGNVVDVSRSNDFSFTEMAKQTAISAGTAALGAGIGKITGNIINPYATSMTNSVILGNTAEIASDMTLSLSADYLIASAQAGQFVDADEFFSWDRILGEGQNQIRGLLIGIASSKMNSLDAASVDTVRAGFDGKTGTDDVGIPVKTGNETDISTGNGDNDVSVKTGTEIPTVKIDDVEIPKTQQEALTIAGRLIIEENNPQKAVELLSSFGMSEGEVFTFLTETSKVKQKNTVNIDDSSGGDTVSPEIKESRYQDLLSKDVLKEVAEEASGLSDEQYLKFEKYFEEYDDYIAINLAKLSDEQYVKFEQYTQTYGESIALKLAGLSDEQYERFDNFISNGVSPNFAIRIASSEDKFSRLQNLILSGLTSEMSTASEIAAFDDVKFSRFESLIAKGIDANISKDASKLRDEKYQKFEIFLEKGISPNDACIATGYDDVKAEKFISLRQKGFSLDDVVIALSYDDVKSERFISLREKGVSSYDAFTAVEYDDVRAERFISLRQKGVSSYKAKEFLSFDDVRYSKLEALISKGIVASDAQRLSLYDDSILSKIEPLLSKGVSIKTAERVASYDDVKYSRFETLISEGMDSYIACRVSAFDDAQYSQFESLRLQGVETTLAEIMVSKNLDYEQSIKYFSEEKLGYDISRVAGELSLSQVRNLGELFDSINYIKNGKRIDPEMGKWKMKVGDLEVEICTDNNLVFARNLTPDMDLNTVKIIFPEKEQAIKDALLQLAATGQKVPERIYITDLFAAGSNAAGEYCPANRSCVFLKADYSMGICSVDYLKDIIYHENAHSTDYENGVGVYYSDFHGASLINRDGRFVGHNAVRTSDIRRLISDYALTNNHEFVAEVSTLITKGIIKIDQNGEYFIETDFFGSFENAKGRSFYNHSTDSQALKQIMELYEYMTDFKIARAQQSERF